MPCVRVGIGYVLARGQAAGSLATIASLQTQLTECRLGLADKDIANANAGAEVSRLTERLRNVSDTLIKAEEGVKDLQRMYEGQRALAEGQAITIMGITSELEHHKKQCVAESEKLFAEIEVHKQLRIAHNTKCEAYAMLEGTCTSMRAELAKQNEVLEQWKVDVNTQFRLTAAELMDQKSRALKEDSKASVAELLAPVQEKFKEFADKVESMRVHGAEQHGNITQQLLTLTEGSARLSDEAHALAEALKGKSQIMGAWGENVLERILQANGMQPGLHYLKQEVLAATDDEGVLRTDFTLLLPTQGEIVIDSKVTLKSYIDYVNAPTPEVRNIAARDMIDSIKGHVGKLGANRYHARKRESVPLTFMFVPLDALYSEALQLEPGISKQAYDQNVLLVTPNTLMVALKVVTDLWQRDVLAKEYSEIVHLAQNIYNKLVDSSDELQKVERAITTLGSTFGEAYKKLYSGNANIFKSAEEIRRIAGKGSKAGKNLEDVAKDKFSLALEEGEPLLELDAC